MVAILNPLSIWMQLASLFFTLSGIHGDLLVIRLFLSLAYVCLFFNSVLGSPLWPDVSNPGSLGLDGLVWSIIGMYLHGASLAGLILDERKVELEEEEEPLWRMFYRTGGLSKRLFKNVISPNVKIVEFSDGEVIPTDNYFYVLYMGRVMLHVIDREEKTTQYSRVVGSGGMFDFEHLGMFHQDSVFRRNRIAMVVSIGHTKLYQFSGDNMTKISHHRYAKGVWQALLIYNLSYVVEAYMEPDVHQDMLQSNYHDKIFDPLKEWEHPRKILAGSGGTLQIPFKHLARYIYHSFSPPWPFGGHPSGIRQTLLPPPPAMPSGDPSTGPRFHRLQSALLHKTSRFAMSVTKSFGKNFTPEPDEGNGAHAEEVARDLSDHGL